MAWCREAVKEKRGFCSYTRLSVKAGAKLAPACYAWNSTGPNGLCHPDLLSKHPCPSGTVCVAFLQVLHEKNAKPASLTLSKNVFWGNRGPDVLLDMAGKTKLDRNLYLFCPPSPYNAGCKPKVAYRRGVNRSNGTSTWVESLLAPGATIVWQNPSPYEAEQYRSSLGGNDLFRTLAGQSLLFSPGICQALSLD